MTPGLVRLPATVMDEGDTRSLARCADAVATGRVVLIGQQRTPEGHELDAFVVAVAVRVHTDADVGVACRVGAGRAASIIAREATAAQLLGACAVLLLEGDVASCRDAATVITTLFVEGTHTVATDTARIDGARNLPVPDVAGGPGVYWRDGDEVWRGAADGAWRVGATIELGCAAPMPEPADDELVLLEHPVVGPDELVGALLL